MKIAQLLALIVFASTAQAQFTGVAAYAARSPHFPCDQYLNMVSPARYPGIAILWDAFGEDNTCLERFLEVMKDRPHMVEIHPFDNTSVRSRTTEPGEVFYGLSKARLNQLLEARDPGLLEHIRQNIRPILAELQAHGSKNTLCLITTGLEDDYTPAAFAVLVQVIREEWPYLIARSPDGGAGGAQGLVSWVERHGTGAHSGIVDEDGDLSTLKKDKRFLDRNGGALLRLLWRPDHQGRKNNNQPVYPRRNRHFVITNSDVDQLGKLLSHY